MLERTGFSKLLFSFFSLLLSVSLFAQSNSPYSRFGLGDLSPTTNTNTRGMGGIAAGYADVISVNYSNPASYSQFQTFIEPRSKKVSQGRVVFDVGVNLGSRSLIQPNTPNKFTASDLIFSNLHVGLPITRNWGMAFGIRPVSKIGYMINHYERLADPITGQNIDSAVTQYRGSGGLYLPTIGTGVAIKNFSLGVNAGFLFGNRENTTLRSFINDTVFYYSSQHTSNTSYNSFYFDAGLQYLIKLPNNLALRLGVTGNMKTEMDAKRDVLRQTYTRGTSGEELQLDSVYASNNESGIVVYPATYKAGFVLQKTRTNGSGWLFGADYTKGKWSQYRYYGQTDSVQDNWTLNVGGQISPRPRANYFSRVSYRFGFYTGLDYIKVQNDLPQYGVSFGMGLPIPNFNRLSQNQFTVVNLGFEYGKRGDDKNLLKENLFRVSLGLNFTDLWFGKRKYE